VKQIATFLAGIIVGAAIFGCSLLVISYLPRPSIIVLRNASLVDLTDVRILLPDVEIWKGNVAAGQTIKAEGFPRTEGQINIQAVAGGAPLNGSFSSVTPGVAYLHYIIISPKMDMVSWDCSPRTAKCY
jgi:hypothetical protein